MNRLLLIAAVALALPAAALAKGPSEAALTGPGLDNDGIALTGLGDDSGIVSQSGFFPAAFGQSPDPMLAAPPGGKLGPKYTLTYTVPGPSGSDATIVQDVYPYAEPEPVTYMPPGQSFFDTEQTRGGWYVSTTGLRELLVDAGLPAEAPAPGTGGSVKPIWPWVVGALALLAALGLAAWFARARWISAIRTPSVS
jgi:hypothetical protein